MKPNFLSVGCFTVGVFAALSFASTASASYVYVDDKATIYQYATDGSVAPGSNIFSSSAQQTDTALAFNPTGALFAATTGSPSGIYQYSGTGTTSQFVGITGGANGIAINSLGDIFVGADGGAQINEYSPGGSQLAFSSGSTGVMALALDSNGDLFDSDSSHNLYEFSGGTRTTIASGLFFGEGLALDSAGDIFVSYSTFSSGSGIEEYSPNASSPTGYGSGTSFVTFTGIIGTGLAFDPETGDLLMTWENSGTSGGGLNQYSSTGALTPLQTYTVAPSGVAVVTPEPASLVLLLGGVVSISLLRRPKK